MEYKITNKKTGSSEVMNYEQICNRIITCKGKFFEKYTNEHISKTPVQDKLNEKRFCWLDIIFTICATSVALLLIYQYAI